MLGARNVATARVAAIAGSLACITLAAAGCVFAPELGDGALQCGPSALCPSGYACAADARCYRRSTPPDLAGADLAGVTPFDFAAPVDDMLHSGADMGHAGSGDMATATSSDMACKPSVSCGTFCGTMADDGCGQALRCDCARPDTCSAQTANRCDCTPITSCDAAQAHCGTISDGCGGVLNCGACSGKQICGAAPNPYTCGNQTMCTPITCQKGQCGTLDDQCTGVVDCGECPAGQVCGGAGVAHFCG